MRIDELILDWNGTVMADLHRSWQVTNQLLTDVDLPGLSLDQFQDRFELPLRSFFSAIDVPEDRLDEVERRWNAISADHPAPLAPGARELLERCKAAGVPVGIVTGADPDLVRVDARRHGIRGLLSWIIGPAEDKRSSLVAAANGKAHNVAYVGDTTHDIASARAAGLIAVGSTGGYTPEHRIRRARPDLVVADLSSLVPFLPATRPQAGTTRSSCSPSTRSGC